MLTTADLLMNASILVPVLFSLLRFHAAGAQFRPLIICLWLGVLNEIMSMVLGKIFHNTNVNNNVYVLAESLLLLWQLQRWGLFRHQNKIYYCIGIIFIAEWIVEDFFYHPINYISSWFRVLYSFIIVLFSLLMMNQLMIAEKRSLLKNPVFICCVAFISYFTLKIIVEIFWLYGIGVDSAFRVQVFKIQNYVNVISNLLYAAAFLCISSRQRLTLQY